MWDKSQVSTPQSMHAPSIVVFVIGPADTPPYAAGQKAS